MDNEAISNIIQENIDMRDNIADAYSAIFEQDATVTIPIDNEGALNDENLPQTIRNIKTFQIDENDKLHGHGNKIFAERGILGEDNTSNNLDYIVHNNGIYFLKKEYSYDNIPINLLEDNNIYCLQIIKIKDTAGVLQRFLIINDTQIKVYERIYQSLRWSEWKLATKENVSNKATSLNDPSDETYPTTLAVKDALDKKVDKEEGKGLIDKSLITKLNEIEAEANKTIIDNSLSQSGQAADSSKVGEALSTKENVSNKINSLKNPSENTYPTTQAISKAIYRGEVDNVENQGLLRYTNIKEPILDENGEDTGEEQYISFLDMIDGSYINLNGTDMSNFLNNDQNQDKISNEIKEYSFNPKFQYILKKIKITDRWKQYTLLNAYYENILFVGYVHQNQNLFYWNTFTDKTLTQEDLPAEAKAVGDALNNKIDKEDGKSLSANDFTDELKNKLNGIEEGANNITVDSVLSDTSENPLQNKIIQQTLDELKKDSFMFKSLSAPKTIEIEGESIEYIDLNEIKENGHYFLSSEKYYSNSPLSSDLIKDKNFGGVLEVFKNFYGLNSSGDPRYIIFQRMITTNGNIYIRKSNLYNPKLINNPLSFQAWNNKNLNIDKTLTQENALADAKAVGDALNNKEDKSNKVNSLDNPSNETYPTTQAVSDILYHGFKDNLETACPLRYTSWADMFNGGITSIENMGLNTRVLVQNTNDNKEDLSSFLTSFISKYGEEELNINDYYVISKINLYHNPNWTITADLYTIQDLNTSKTWTGYTLGKTAIKWNDILVEQNIYNTTYENNYDIISNPNITTDTNNFLFSTGDTSDRSADIATMLNQTGCCTLGSGDFYISSGVELPENAMIKGQGKSTKVIWKEDSSTNTNYIFKLSTRCSLSDMQILGNGTALTRTVSSNIGDLSAILIQGTYTNPNSNNSIEKTNGPSYCTISNLFVGLIPGCGIKLTNTGMSPTSHTQIINCNFIYCDCGIYDGTYSEFHMYSNNACNRNYYGVIVKGGNNRFSNCDFSQNRVGIYLNCKNSLGAKEPNNAHGIFVNCEIAHSYGENGIANQGQAIICDGVNNSEIFNTCQIGYGQIEIRDSNGVKFHNCAIGRPIKNSQGQQIGKNINFINSNRCLLNGCSIGDNIEIAEENSSDLNIMNCTLGDQVKIIVEEDCYYTNIINCIIIGDTIIMPTSDSNVNIINCFKQGQLYNT